MTGPATATVTPLDVRQAPPDPMLAGQAGGEVLVNTLRVDTLTDPIGLGDAAPMLSWRLSSARQTAYQIQVASSMARLRQPDLVDSGEVSSSDSSNVVYAGAVLGSRQAVVWRVRMWDGTDAASAWSMPASWEMGLLANGDWTARW